MGQAQGAEEARGIDQPALLETVIIFTERMEEMAKFYQEALQLGPFDSSPSHLGQQVGHVYLGFDQIEGVGASSDAGVTLWFTVSDLQATFDRVVSMGARVRYPPTEKPWGARLASVYDPDGNLLGLSQRQATGRNLKR
jgi:predicted enzyme related to lactoylglutathione lyase